MSLLRFLGLGGDRAGRDQEPESLAALAASLDGADPDEARLVSAFAYLLARVAGADLRTEDAERTSIVERLRTFASLDESSADTLARAAVHAADLHGASDHHLVARAFRDATDHDERIRLLRCLYAVAAADDTITTREDNEIFEIARALGVDHDEVVALRSEWREHLGTLKALPAEGRDR